VSGSIGVVGLIMLAVGLYLLLDRSGLVRVVVVPLLMIAAFGLGIGYGLYRWKGVRPADVVFILTSIVAIVSAFRVVTHPKTLFSAFYFIVLVAAVAVMVLLLGAQFLSAALVLIYAWAIIVVYVFVIMLAQELGFVRYELSGWRVVLSVIAAATIAGTSVMLLGDSAVLTPVQWDQSNVAAIGKTILVDYVVTLELAGVLLLSAVIGAIALAKRDSLGRDGYES